MLNNIGLPGILDELESAAAEEAVDVTPEKEKS